MDPILNSYLIKFKQAFEINTESTQPEEQKKKEADAFEKFANYVIFSEDSPDVFTANMELFDFTCVGAFTTGIDGIGIRVNDKLVRDIEDVKLIVQDSKKISVDFIFVQTKMGTSFDIGEFNKFGLAVKNFFSKGYLPEKSHMKEIRKIKDFIYSDNTTILKLDTNPRLYLHYITTGNVPTDENYTGTRSFLEKELSDYYFEEIKIGAIGGKQLIKICKELENQFEIQINVRDIFPLIVDNEEAVKKAYSFTCDASELLKILTKEDGTLRRSLFNDNVRDYLGHNPVNTEIERQIIENPEIFLLCNNGVTIVCNDFDQVRDKLVKIENPRIVNGCQTCNAIFNQKDNPNAAKVQLLLRVISTDSLSLSNQIVRGTNKQNQVLDEAFEATLPFHQEELEPFFLAMDKPQQIYYERRSKQYNNDPLIRKTRIVNVRILTQTFVAMFMQSPHEAHIHEAKLLDHYAGDIENRKIFRNDHSPYIYYVCALTYYMFEKYFKERKIGQQYKTYRGQLYLIFRYSVGAFPPALYNSKNVESYCKKVIEALTEPQFENHVTVTLKLFNELQGTWRKLGKSRFGIKDRRDFTELLIEKARKTFISGETPLPIEKDDYFLEGKLLQVIWRNNIWFGFIERGGAYPNVYFDSRGYNGDPDKLIPQTKVKYKIATRQQGDYATEVHLMD